MVVGDGVAQEADMGLDDPRRGTGGGLRGTRDPELGVFEHAVAIAILLGLIALAIMSGCSSERVRPVEGELKATPSPLDFGVVAVERRVEVPVALTNHGGAPLTILSIEPVGELPPDFVLPDPGQEVLRTGETRELLFGFEPTEERRYAGRVQIRTNSQQQPTVLVDLRGEGARPAVSCTQRLDFGRIVLNTDKVLHLVCVNHGRVEAELVIDEVEGPDRLLFTVGESLGARVILVPPGQQRSLDVRYVARFLGRAQAVARLVVPGALEPQIVVELSGEGFASDLVATPNCVHFGAVSPGNVVERQVTVYNGGNQPVTFEPPTLLDTSGVFGITGIAVEGTPAPLTVLAGGQTAVISLAFAPPALGDYGGVLQLRSDDPINPRMEICLTGQGGGPDILVDPPAVDFGQIATGMRSRAWVSVRNVGTLGGGNLEIHSIEVSDPVRFRVGQPTLTSLAPGSDIAMIEIDFLPSGEGVASGSLTIHSNDGDQPAVVVPLQGGARAMPPCDYVAEPPQVRFGAVQLGSIATLSAALRNVGTDDCIFAAVDLSNDTPSVFALPRGGVGVATVPPGAALTVPIRFTASPAGSYTGALEYSVSDPAASEGTIPILASAVDGCLVAQPGSLEFGPQRISCPGQIRSMRLTNRCGGNVTVHSVTLEQSSGEFSLVGPPPMPLQIGPNGTAIFTVHYDASDPGDDGATLLFGTSVYDIAVPIHGAGVEGGDRTDSFRQAERSAVDVLFVVDNSGSMMEEQNAIGAAFDDFIQYAVSQGIDYHIGVTTTGISPSGGGWAACPGGVDGGEAGRLFPVTNERPRYITPTTPDPIGVFGQNVQVGVCHWWEEGLEAAYRALSPPLVNSLDAPDTNEPGDGNLGFYRPEAKLSVIIVTDEDDHSPRDPGFYIDFFRNLKGAGGADRVRVHGVLGDGCPTASGNGVRYGQVIQATGGTVEPICTTDWGESLANLAQSTFGYRLRFTLTGTPTGAITVRVNGTIVTSGWSYDAAANQVVFEESSAPPPGSRIDITYEPACGT